MVRAKIQIKKIENIAARQVTFSKRRKGLFKKAQELSTLCDADVGVIVFSSAAKLHEFSTSRMTQVIQKYIRHTGNNPQQLNSSFLESYLLEENCALMRKELGEKSQELCQMEGEDLEGLGLEDLCKLERQIDKGFARVRRMKDHMLQKTITEFKEKEITLVENNRTLIEKISNATDGQVLTSKQQLAHFPDCIHNQNIVLFDTSLRLGLI